MLDIFDYDNHIKYLEPKNGQSTLQRLNVYYANVVLVENDMHVYDVITRILIIKNVCCRNRKLFS